ncbi:MAG: hypothetical protein ACM37W_02550 [Actinomycetota bacterium]
MTEPDLTARQLALLTQALEAAKKAELRARETSELAIAIEEKYHKWMEEVRATASG